MGLLLHLLVGSPASVDCIPVGSIELSGCMILIFFMFPMLVGFFLSAARAGGLTRALQRFNLTLIQNFKKRSFCKLFRAFRTFGFQAWPGMVHPWPGIKVAIAIPGPSMDQAWPGMELPWTIHGHGWNAMESQYGYYLVYNCIAAF